MKLTYGQLETTLAGHLGVHPDKVPTLRSRIKQLQRLKFPPGVNVGRGEKMEYSEEHLFQLVTVFELLGSGLPAQAACNLTNRHWKKFAAGYALAALHARTVRRSESEQTSLDSTAVLAVLKVQSLHEIQFDRHGHRRLPSEIYICDATAFNTRLPADSGPTALLIRLSLLLHRVLEIARERAGVQRASAWVDDFHAWLPKDNPSDVLEEQYSNILFAGRYPDRSNLKMRQRLHRIYGNDPDSLTPDGAEEARDFVQNGYGGGVPF